MYPTVSAYASGFLAELEREFCDSDADGPVPSVVAKKLKGLFLVGAF